MPGGRIYVTGNWIVEHCIGNLGYGTVIIKTKKHKENFSQCSNAEIMEFANLLKILHLAIEKVCNPDQIYISKWGEEVKHLHIVIQPIYQKMKMQYQAKGPSLQAKMLNEGKDLDWKKAEKNSKEVKSIYSK